MSAKDKFNIDFLKSIDLTNAGQIMERAESSSRYPTIEAPVATGGDASTFTISMGGRARELSIQEFQSILEQGIKRSIAPNARRVIDETIQGLLKTRDFLGLQLDHAWGNIPDEDFEERAQTYLATKEQGDRATLSDKVKILHWYLSIRLDSETVADIFNCRLEDAELALQGVKPHLLGSPSQGGKEQPPNE